MERKKETVKMEDPMKSSYYLMDGLYGSNNSSNMVNVSYFDYNGEGEKGCSLGFMELLGMQDFGVSSSSSVFDIMPQQTHDKITTTTTTTTTTQISTGGGVQEPSEVVNTPATPNSSSISSESSGPGPPNELQSKALDNDNQQQLKTKKQLKPKKTSQKKQRVPRFAFMTKSDVDHLEDGYRWRKYGQKAVKNSPFPRSYYRCTSASCNVKKRVERCFNDPSTVVTTYEGQHTHQSPTMPRHTTPVGLLSPSGFSFSNDGANNPFAQQMHMMSSSSSSHQHQIMHLNTTLNHCNYTTTTTSIDDPIDHQELRMRRFSTPQSAAALLRDDGLLQDIVPSIIRKDD